MQKLLPGLLLAVFLANPGTGETMSVKDLRYGVTLYHFYQQHYFEALTELTAAQQLSMLPNHADEAELLRGGMSLSYGMDREAGRVFAAMLEQPRDSIDADRAWYYLGKLAWRRGDVAASEAALSRIKPDYTGSVADEAHYLRAVLALENGDEKSAQQHLQQVVDSCPLKPYYFYNLGVRRSSEGDWERAAQAFRQVDHLACTDEEGSSLRDKAYTAAGYSSLAGGDAARAATDFLAVRLRGSESDRALLGYGWSRANQGDYAAALAPWRELHTRSLVSASARESLLAVPFAYEQLQRPLTALEHYLQAAELYAAERAGLEAAIERMQEEDLLHLFGLDAVEDPQWLGGEDPLPTGTHGVYLSHLLSTDEVQLALRELHDLRHIQRKLLLAQERLTVLRQVDREQRQSWTETVEGGGAETLALQREQLLRRAGQLRRQLDAAIANNDARSLAGPAQAARWQRLESAEQLAGRLQKKDALARLRLMRGMMQWQDDEAFPERRWRLRQDMEVLESLAADSASAYGAVQTAVAGSARPVFEQRITEMEQRTAAQVLTVADVVEVAESQLRTVALEELEHQRHQLAVSEGQARLAVARLYDRASPEVPR